MVRIAINIYDWLSAQLRTSARKLDWLRVYDGDAAIVERLVEVDYGPSLGNRIDGDTYYNCC
jgi:hypothetical protein